MSELKNKEELLDAWFRNELTPEEQKTFQKLRGEARHEDYLKNEELIVRAVQEKGRIDLAAEMREWVANQKPVNIRRRLLIWGTIAASFLIFFLINFDTNPLNLHEYDRPFPNVLSATERSGQSIDISELGLAMQYYEAQAWQRAQESFATLHELGKAPIETKLYLGISAYHNGSYQIALDALREVNEQVQDLTFKEPATWFTALVNLKMGNEKVARNLLEKIAGSQHYKGAAAQKLLNSL